MPVMLEVAVYLMKIEEQNSSVQVSWKTANLATIFFFSFFLGSRTVFLLCHFLTCQHMNLNLKICQEYWTRQT